MEKMQRTQEMYHTMFDNGDGSVTDMVTGLMWQQSPDNNCDGIINHPTKLAMLLHLQVQQAIG